jgi:transposase
VLRPRALAAIAGGCSRRARAICAGWSRRRPTSRSPSCRRNSSDAAGCGPGSRPSTTRSAGSACRIKKSLRAAEQDRPDVAGKRRLWRVWQRFIDPARFVFLDETGTATNLARRYGRSPRGERLVAAVPHGHWRTTTFIAGLRQTGIVAPLLLDGPMTGTAFRAYVEQFLAPALRPGDVVVLDNLAAHKVHGVRQALAAAGASLLDLPPYSPDFNPIEQLFPKLKALLRKAALRTKDELWSTIGRLLATVPPAECARYLRHCDYGSN